MEQIYINWGRGGWWFFGVWGFGVVVLWVLIGGGVDTRYTRKKASNKYQRLAQKTEVYKFEYASTYGNAYAAAAQAIWSTKCTVYVI